MTEERKQGEKTPKAEIQLRVMQVVQMKIQGARSHQILRYAAEMSGWNVSKRTVERYMQLADQEIIRLKERNMDAEFSKAILRLEELYNKCNAIQDYKNCLQVQKEINEVFGFKALEIRSTDTQREDLSGYSFKQLFALKHGRIPTREELIELGEEDEEQEDPDG